MDRLAKEILKDIALEEITPRVVARSLVDHWPSAILLERASYLKKLARFGDGSASEILKEYPLHSAVLSFWSRDCVAEVNQNFANLFYVLSGVAVLVTGGTLTHARKVGPGEINGDSIEGGARLELKSGDFAHVPAGLPHQMQVAGEKTVTCLVMKIQESA